MSNKASSCAISHLTVMAIVCVHKPVCLTMHCVWCTIAPNNMAGIQCRTIYTCTQRYTMCSFNMHAHTHVHTDAHTHTHTHTYTHTQERESFFVAAGHHDFELESFSNPSMCTVCSKLLWGTYFQGYMCQSRSFGTTA